MQWIVENEKSFGEKAIRYVIKWNGWLNSERDTLEDERRVISLDRAQ